MDGKCDHYRVAVRSGHVHPPNAMKPRPQDWSEAEMGRLKDMARRKADTREIAVALGRHVASVKKKVRELGLVPRKR
jgi:transposase